MFIGSRRDKGFFFHVGRTFNVHALENRYTKYDWRLMFVSRKSNFKGTIPYGLGVLKILQPTIYQDSQHGKMGGTFTRSMLHINTILEFKTYCRKTFPIRKFVPWQKSQFTEGFVNPNFVSH